MFKYLLSALLLFSFYASSQYNFSAGLTTVKSFGVKTFYTGLHISGEYSNDDFSSLFGRISFLPGRKGEMNDEIAYTIAKSQTNQIYSFPVGVREKINYTMIELGKRYYFGGGIDNGFGFYGGSNICLVFNQVKFETEDYDENEYNLFFGSEEVKNRDDLSGSKLRFAFALNGGLKNTFSFGTLYFDLGLSIPFIRDFSNELAYNSSLYRHELFFNFNLGFKKIFY